MSAKSKKKQPGTGSPTIENRRARHDFTVEATLECGIKLVGTEVKAIRLGRVSLAEGFARAYESPLALKLHGVHIGEYPPAGESRQHVPTRTRTLLANKREIRKLVDATRAKGTTLVPLKLYFLRGRAKLLIGIAQGKRKSDKRQDLTKREHQRDIDRAMSKRM